MPDGQFWVGPYPPVGSEPLGIFYPRTGTLGGCAEHNAMILIYPAESDWNNIATLTGDESWSAENMRKYFVKLENNKYLSPSPASAGHGFDGWLDSTLADPRPLFNDPTLVGMLHSASEALGKASNFFDARLTSTTNLARIAAVDLNNASSVRDTTTGVYQLPLSITNSTRTRSSHRDLILNTAHNKLFKLKLQLNTLVILGDTSLNTTNDACFAQWLDNDTDHGIYGGNSFAFGLTHSSSVADRSMADLIVSGSPAIFRGYFPGWTNRTAVDAHHWTWFVLKAHRRNNAGTVTLTSSDPRDVPKISFRSFSVGGEEDLQATYEGIRLARKMIAAAQPLIGNITEEIPGPNIQTEAEIKQRIRDEAWGHHASCTVPIGPDNDKKKSVLDSKFRVKGVNGLRVVDASVFPKILSLYIVSAVYMISEKAADVIIQDARGH